MRRLSIAGLVLGVIGAAGVVISWVTDPTRAAFSWLVAFYVGYTLAVGALILLLIGYAADAVWIVVLRRPVEAIVGTLPLLALLCVPVLVALGHVYSWVPGGRALSAHAEEVVHAKAGWLNVPFFIVRSVVYLLVPIVIGELLIFLSGREDGVRAKRRRIGAVGLAITVLVSTFAGFDWLMSVEPTYFSTAFGLIPTTGGFMAALSAIALVIAFAHRRRALLEVGPDHLHAIGKLMFTAVCFWAYIAFFQYMLGWIANLPPEARFFLPRTHGGWQPVALVLVAGHFIIPFALLLSRDLKRHAATLGAIGVGLVLMHWLDVWWLALPAIRPAGPTFALGDAAALLAVFGLGVAVAAFRASRAPAVPLHDPLLPRSLRYRSE